VKRVVLAGVTKEQDDKVRTTVDWLNRVPDGGISHVTWWEGNDCHNIDAWENEAAFNAVGGQRLRPAIPSGPRAEARRSHDLTGYRAIHKEIARQVSELVSRHTTGTTCSPYG
jgi:hypothetical protein